MGIPAFAAFRDIDAAFRAQVAQRGEAIALLCGDTTRSFASLAGEVDRLGAWMVARGWAAGTRLVWWGKTHSDFIALTLAAARTGMVMTVVSWRLADREVAAIMADCGAAATFVTADFADRGPGDAFVAGDAPVAGLLPVGGLDGPPVDAWPAIDPGRPFLQLYTSGTTGLPKGVPQSHTNHLAAYASWAASDFGIWSAADRCLVGVPVFHAIGANFCLFSLLQGASIHLLPEFSIDGARAALACGAITRMPLVPTMIDMLTRDPAIAALPHDRLRTIVYGGSSIPAPVLRRGMAVFSCDFVQCYAATETTAAGTCLSAADHRGASPPLAACGRAMPGVELTIADPDGRTLPLGAVGEIRLRGENIMAGYWHRAEESAQALVDGWYRTGDAGFQDESGLVTIVDRTRDMMISGGENVYPSEVEAALREHPGIADCCVVGAPDERWGHRIAAAIVIADGAAGITLDGLRGFLDPLLARYKHPRQLLVIDALPRNPSGKLLRKPLIDRATRDWTMAA